MGEREEWQDADDAFNAALDEAPAGRAEPDAEPWPAAVRALGAAEVSRLMALGEWYDEPWYDEGQ